MVIGRGAEEIGLAADQLRCDVLECEAALADGDLEGALALYRGDLLHGFHIADAPEFERWLERERARLRRQAAEATWALAEAWARSGDRAGAEFSHAFLVLASARSNGGLSPGHVLRPLARAYERRRSERGGTCPGRWPSCGGPIASRPYGSACSTSRL